MQTPRAALLKGLLYCGRCAQPMAATYCSKGGRRYRYYVCRAGRQKGSSRCAVKFIAAHVIEQSVIEQVLLALSDEKVREQLHISETEWQAFAEKQSGELIRTMVRRVFYDTTKEAVSVELGDED